MFVHHCTSCARRQLIFPSQVTSSATTDQGVTLTFSCWCGAEQTAARGLAGASRTAAPAERELVGSAAA